MKIMKDALEAIAGMKIKKDTNFVALLALCIAIAQVSLEQAEGEKFLHEKYSN